MPVRCEAAVLVCTNVATQQCVVCGRLFCPRHGDDEGPHCWRCKRDYLRKLADEETAQAELARREMAAEHNSEGRCGWAGCDEPQLVLCRHCGYEYCGQHSNRYHYAYRYRSRRGVEMRRAQI